MANFLADLGRSGLAAVGQDLLDRSVAVRQQGADIARQNLGMAIDIEKFKTEQTMNQQAIEKGQFELQELQRQEAEANYKIPVKSLQYSFGKTGMPEEATTALYEMAKQNNLIGSNENGEYITRRDAASLNLMIQEDTSMQENLFRSTITGYEREAAQIQAGLQSGEIKGKDAEAAQQRLDQLVAPDGLIAQGYNFLSDTLPERKEEAVKTHGTPRVFTATPAQAALFPNVTAGESYVGYFAEDGATLVNPIRPATDEEKGVAGAGDITPSKALDKVTQLREAFATIEQGNPLSGALIGMLEATVDGFTTPDNTNPEDIALAKEQILKTIDFYSQYIPGEFLVNDEPAPAPPEPAVPPAPVTPSNIRTGEVTVPIPPPELQEKGAVYVRTVGEYHYYRNPDDPTKAYRVKK